MKQEIFSIFVDNIITAFYLDTAKRRMELYLDDYWDNEKKETVYGPCCFTIWGWEEATWIEKGVNHVSSLLPLTDIFSPLTEIYDMDLTDGLLTIEAVQENYMVPTMYFKNCSFSFGHVDMSHHINVFLSTVPDTILKRDCSDLVIPKVNNTMAVKSPLASSSFFSPIFLATRTATPLNKEAMALWTMKTGKMIEKALSAVVPT